MIALRSGENKVGLWVKETVNILDDYRRLFHQDPPKIITIAIMSDSDNSKLSSKAFLDDLILSDSLD